MRDVCVIVFDTYNHGTFVEVCESKKDAMQWLKDNCDFSEKQIRKIDKHNFLEHGEKDRESSLSLKTNCPVHVIDVCRARVDLERCMLRKIL